MSRVVLLVPRRPDGGERDALWSFCRHRWERLFPDWPIYEGHHLDGPFNRGLAINRAAVLADLDGRFDVAVVVDGDVAVDPAQLLEAVTRCQASGRLTFPFTRYTALDQAMTRQVLGGWEGSWHGSRDPRQPQMSSHVSSVLAVPRRLWDEIGGFDERFRGWGCDDLAFVASCNVLGGPIERVRGDVWHLWHPWSPERNMSTPDYRAGVALAARYKRANSPTEMRKLIAERTEPTDSVLLTIVSNGRRDCIARAIETCAERVTGPIGRRVIVDDSGDPNYRAWLGDTFPSFDVVTTIRRGFDQAMIAAFAAALNGPQPWVLHVEEDFEFVQAVDLMAMQRVMNERPHLAQMMLRRQPWFPAEIEVGGFVEQNPDSYIDHHAGDASWLEHQLGWWTNPCLIRQSFIASHPWPAGPRSEAMFGRQVMTGDAMSGVWGSRGDAPWVIHDGQRVGTSY